MAAGRERAQRARHARSARRPMTDAQTFYYTNQQSARLMFYHDHSWGITRLNVYAGEAAGYVLRDADREEAHRHRRPSPARPTASRSSSRTAPSFRTMPSSRRRIRPGTRAAGVASGTFWYHHVYMPAQNPGDPGGMSAFGRWMYGPWFWPPADGRSEPVLRQGPEGPTTPRTDDADAPATWTTRRRGSTRPTRSASRSRSPERRTSRRGWNSSTTRRSSTGRPTRP